MKNNFKELEDTLPTEGTSERIKKRVDSRMGLMRFITDIVDLYVGRVGVVLTDMISSFGKEDPQDQMALGSSAQDKEGNTPPTEAGQ